MMQDATAHDFDDDDGFPNVDIEALPAGTQLLNGQYTVDRYLSSGGFGITYLARDSLDRTVVIKECYPEALCSRKNMTVRARTSGHVTEFQSLVSMFVREARSIAKLKHPNIVGVHQVFEDNQTAYMALDLIEGRDLLCIIEEDHESLTPDQIQGILITLLDAISTVHDQDMLHRDISPDNILVDPWGKPVLIDFGAAREQASKKSRAISALLVVKDGYSPQEFYISGGQQGPFSDLYSLAATFYHVITGMPPPNSQNRLAAMAANRADPYEPLLGRVEGYEPAFLSALDQAINVFPADRIQTAHDWLAWIDPAKGEPAAPAPRAVTEELQQIVSQFVSEAEQDQDEVAYEPAFHKPDALPQEAPKVLEYLPEDGHEETLPPPAAPRHYEAIERLWDRLNHGDQCKARQKRRRKRRARLGMLLIVSAIAVNIYDNPASNIATYVHPELSQLLVLGQEWADKTTELINRKL